MENYFLTKVKYCRNGELKPMAEQYLVESFTFSEAETKVKAHLHDYAKDEIMVLSIAKSKISEIVVGNSSINMVDAEANRIFGGNHSATDECKFFKAKVNFITLDEKTGKEKKTSMPIIVEARSVNAANDTLNEHMKGTISDWEIGKIEETKIIEILK